MCLRVGCPCAFLRDEDGHHDTWCCSGPMPEAATCLLQKAKGSLAFSMHGESICICTRPHKGFQFMFSLCITALIGSRCLRRNKLMVQRPDTQNTLVCSSIVRSMLEMLIYLQRLTSLQWARLHSGAAVTTAQLSHPNSHPRSSTMCYHVYTHTLRCDVRPVLSNGKTALVDPYAIPRRCRCRHERQVWSRHHCRDHGCCSLSVRRYTCESSCRTSIVYHVYIPRVEETGVHFQRSARDPEWRDLSVFDNNVFPVSSRRSSFSSSSRAEQVEYTCSAESVEFKLARDQILKTGRVLNATLLDFDDARSDVRTLTHRHAAAHGSRCGRSSHSRDCTWVERIDNAREQCDDLEAVAGGFKQLWRRWTVYLRNLERGGDRRLSGLEDLRKRQGTAPEREEYETLRSSFSRDVRADEEGMRAARERERMREAARQRERSESHERRYGPRRYDDDDDFPLGRSRRPSTYSDRSWSSAETQRAEATWRREGTYLDEERRSSSRSGRY